MIQPRAIDGRVERQSQVSEQLDWDFIIFLFSFVCFDVSHIASPLGIGLSAFPTEGS